MWIGFVSELGSVACWFEDGNEPSDSIYYERRMASLESICLSKVYSTRNWLGEITRISTSLNVFLDIYNFS